MNDTGALHGIVHGVFKRQSGVVGIVLIAAWPVSSLEVEMDIFLIRQCPLIPLTRKTSAVSANRFRTGFRHGEANLTPTAVDDLGASIHQAFVARIDERVIVVGAVAVAVARSGIAEKNGRCESEALHVGSVRDAIAVRAENADHVGPVGG